MADNDNANADQIAADAAAMDEALAALLSPEADVPDTENVTSPDTLTELEASVLRDSFAHGQRIPTSDGGQAILGKRVRIPRAFSGTGDLQVWKKAQAREIQVAAKSVFGGSTRNTGQSLGWSPAILQGSHVEAEVNGVTGPVYLLYLRAYKKLDDNEPTPAEKADGDNASASTESKTE